MVVRPAARGVRRAARRFPGARGPRAGMDAARTPRSTRAKSRRCCATMRARCSTRCTATSPTSGTTTLRGMDRLRFVINVFTRMRFCRARRHASISRRKAAPGEQPEDLVPWFDVPGRASRDVRVICGHWSTLGLKRRKDLLALDTGCVWGGALTAVNLDADDRAGAARLRRASGAGRRRGLSGRSFAPARMISLALGAVLPAAARCLRAACVGDTKPGSRRRRPPLPRTAGIGPHEM